MNKLTLLGIATQPKYDDNNQWTGAVISVAIEAEVEDGDQKGLHRAEIKLGISTLLAKTVKRYGLTESIEFNLMKHVEECLNTCPKKWPGTEHDANNIYEVIRLKLPRFIMKAADGIFYCQNFRTGNISE